MSFDVSADAYLRFMGRYSEPLAVQFADLAGVQPGQRVLDVGCGPGALTAELVRRTGAEAVSAVEPSASFAAAVRERLPGVDVRRSAAEQLPFPDDTFDAALAQLVVHFMTDPVQGLREMSRVTRPGGMVAACVWDHAGGRGPLTAFWSAVRELDPAADDESGLAGVREGHLARLFAQAGLGQAQAGLGQPADADRPGPLRPLRAVVGAVHARRRPGRDLRGLADPGPAGRTARAVPPPAARGPVRDQRDRMGGDLPGATPGAGRDRPIG